MTALNILGTDVGLTLCAQFQTTWHGSRQRVSTGATVQGSMTYRSAACRCPVGFPGELGQPARIVWRRFAGEFGVLLYYKEIKHNFHRKGGNILPK